MKKIIVGISGASGVRLGEAFLQYLPKDIEALVVYSDHSKVVLNKEEKRTYLDNHDIAANIASGSFKTDAMVIIPCSMNTLAKISCGIADNLLTRAASVMIKEKRTLLLAPREMPYSSIALENMLKLSNFGVIIAPPVAGYYANINNIEDMERFFIGKWFDLLGVEHQLFQRWGGN
ncbi:MAG: UbiX family flavin prenyltransferase [Sulfurospirillum sp.]|nr:UbiX family flavin prenyltransferase [Sulfurospirillum sp.]